MPPSGRQREGAGLVTGLDLAPLGAPFAVVPAYPSDARRGKCGPLRATGQAPASGLIRVGPCFARSPRVSGYGPLWGLGARSGLLMAWVDGSAPEHGDCWSGVPIRAGCRLERPFPTTGPVTRLRLVPQPAGQKGCRPVFAHQNPWF